MKNKKMFGGVPAVTEDLRRRIGQGDWKTGERMPSSRELAETYGVSLGTVSRAIAILKNEGLLSAASGSGIYLASKYSASVRTERLTFAIFVDQWRFKCVSPSELIQNYLLNLFNDLILGIQKRSSELKITTTLHLIPDDAYAKEKEYRAFLESAVKGADGVLAVNADCFQKIADVVQVPLVFLNCGTYTKEYYNYNVILPDFYISTCAVTEHLVQRGYRKIGFVGSLDEHLQTYALRRNGFLDTLHASGLELNPAHHFRVAENFYDMCEIADKIFNLPKRERPDALFCVSDLRALALQESFRRKGIKVPDEIALAGFDGSESAVRNRLTSAAQPLLEMGIRGIDTLVMLLQNPGTGPVFQMMNCPTFIGETT